MYDFWNEYPEIINELEEVKEIMKENTKSPEKFIQEPIYSLIDSGGKMIRPALLILGSKLGNFDKDKILPLAAAVELLHIATLAHDDIIDEAKLRRGVESIPSKYGNDISVYCGDYIFSRCFMLISKKYSQETMNKLAKTIFRICKGELKQYSYRYNNTLSIPNYLKIITGKTAAIFSISLFVGACEGGLCRKKEAYWLGQAGLRAGIAFQIIDDCFDYIGSDSSIRKNTQNDLKKGYITLPIIYALKNDKTGKFKDYLKNSNFEKDNLDDIYRYVVKNNGIDASLSLANKYTQRAFNSLDKISDCNTKNILYDTFNKMLIRKH